jgi:hypothetical protein
MAPNVQPDEPRELPMIKRRAVWAVVMSAGVYGAFMLACGDESSSTFEEKPPNSGVDGAPSFNTDAADLGDGAVAPSCTPTLPASFSPAFIAPSKSAACASVNVGEYYDACFTVGDAGTCGAWRASHSACAQCIEASNNSGPIQVYLEGKVRLSNVAGCLALRRDAGTGTDECPGAYFASVECQRQSCLGCLAVNGSSFTDFQTCQKNAKSGPCQSYEGSVTPKCPGGFSSASDCFPTSPSEPPRDYYKRLITQFCGSL